MVTKLLLNQGANTAAIDENGDTPLHFAAIMGHETIVELLLDSGADIDAEDDYGSTSFNFTLIGNNGDAAQLLEIRGANTAVRGDLTENDLYAARLRLLNRITLLNRETN